LLMIRVGLSSKIQFLALIVSINGPIWTGADVLELYQRGEGGLIKNQWWAMFSKIRFLFCIASIYGSNRACYNCIDRGAGGSTEN
jgi:hypothetical protein